MAQPRGARRRRLADERPAAEAELRAAFPRLGVRVVLPPTPGRHSIGALRQAAVRAAKGEVVVHWDDDDLYAPERIERQALPILRGEANLTTLPYSYYLALPANDDGELIDPELYEVTEAMPNMASLVYRRSTAEQFEFADASLGEDLHFAERAVSACHTHWTIDGGAPRTRPFFASCSSISRARRTSSFATSSVCSRSYVRVSSFTSCRCASSSRSRAIITSPSPARR